MAELRTRPPGLAPVTIIPPGEVEITTGKQPGKSKRPNCCHTVDTAKEDRGEGYFAICGARLNGGSDGHGGGGTRHSSKECKAKGHRRCKHCAVIRKADKVRG
jgi:hypothetical protein